MDFVLFTTFFNKIDTITASFVTNMSMRSITAIAPIVYVGLTLSFITYGILIIRGVISYPLMDFLGRSLKISIVTTVALTVGIYQANIADVIRLTPDELVNILIENPAQKLTAAATIDEAAKQGFRLASEAFEHAGFFEGHVFVYCMYGIIILLATSVFVAIGGATLLLTKLVLSILAGIGPFFVVAILWQPTSKFFDLWVAQIINYTLLVVLFTASFGLLVSIYTSYMIDMRLDGTQNIAGALGGATILSISMIYILFQLPGLALGLAGGVSLSYSQLRFRQSGAKKPLKENKPESENSKNETTNSDSSSSSMRVTNETTKTKTANGYYKGGANGNK